jgi:hypothetical protein
MFGAEDEADRRVFIRISPMLTGIVEIEVHPPYVIRSFA